eukprot:jgi/Tetstr1/428880/TSEL_018860.t1
MRPPLLVTVPGGGRRAGPRRLAEWLAGGRALALVAVALTLLTLWRGASLRERNGGAERTSRRSPSRHMGIVAAISGGREVGAGASAGGRRPGQRAETSGASPPAHAWGHTVSWEHKQQYQLGVNEEGDDQDSDDITAGRGRRRGHHHSSHGGGGGSGSGAARAKKLPAGPQLTEGELAAIQAEKLRSSQLGDVYKGQRAWEVEEVDREEAMMGDNLLDNLQAAGLGDKRGEGEGGEYDPVAERIQLVEDAQRKARRKKEARPLEIAEFKEIRSVDRARPASSPKSAIPRSREKDWGWRCSHLKECDEFIKQVEKHKEAMSGVGKEKKPDAISVAERHAGMRTWGAAVARTVAAGEAAACPQDVSGAQDGDQAGKQAVLRAVRDCCRFVLAKHHFLGLEELTLRSEVGQLMGIAMGDAVMATLRQELRHVTHGSVEIIMQGFERWQAGEPINPKAELRPNKPLTSAEKKRRAEQADAEYAVQQATKMEARVRAVERSWGASRLDKLLDEKLWPALDSMLPRLHFRASTFAPSHGRQLGHPGELSEQEMGGVTGNSMAAAAQEFAETKVDEPVPLSLNIQLFLEPGEKLSDVGSRRALSPVLTVERKGSVGSAVHEYKFPPQMLDVLPEADRAWRFRTCAVVGNSGMLLKGERLGAVIDSADAVFRINFAPTRTFEKYVGSKTTFDVVNLHHTEMLLEGKHKAARLINSTMIAFEVTAPAARETLYLDLLRRFSGTNLDHGHVLILSPHLVSHMIQSWGQVRGSFASLSHEANITHTLSHRPDSGFFATMTALQMCEHVHLYGMSNWHPGSEQRYHYFTTSPDMLKGAGKARPFTFTREVLRAMAMWPHSDAQAALTLHKP